MDVRAEYTKLLKHSLVDLLGPVTTRAVLQRDGTMAIEEVPETERADRIHGQDWPGNGMTMIGLVRLTHLQYCIETVLADGVPGDLIEAGVWRGGAAILMRKLLDLHDDPQRSVWLADSFAGLPPPDPQMYPTDTGDPHHTFDYLAVPLEDVRRNFARSDCLDERVRFLPGWFRDTLPSLDNETWSLIRLDGDMYESTMVSLQHLYPRLSAGGFVTIDDYGGIDACRRAVDDFRSAHGINAPLEPIDWAGVAWRKP